ncbi:hypothetical protein SAMN05421805_102304 [Saccharopolyspora antimicrobica]|uniref:Uncharacterized protein n=1 Tax=Saccharopolyspora antimicrobica TaxID=455193 RepID=A0A1I4VP54_9PSEU|nr:hypothetical protein [Saccharopolyspora antimicrobica]RKT87280.1 hypothetical protein ATL45_5683 [Saccharopolyspora antimicrobica]SFN03048.1 hypothetical protein SAMN05421805_102304 [Saccharopolyspora antimicrobica]
MERDNALVFVRRTGDLLMTHEFGVDELMTKLRIWRERHLITVAEGTRRDSTCSAVAA